MATNAGLKKELLDKLGVSQQRLSQLVQKRKAELPMSTEQAVYTIAHDNKIDIGKHLSKPEVTEVRELLAQLKAASPAPAATSSAKPARQRANAPKPAIVTISGVNVQAIPGLTAAHAAEAKVMAEKVYPMVYVFENSARDLVERVLSKAVGADWWSKAVPGGAQEKYRKRKADEAKEPWHGRRGAREIDYVDLEDLWRIINHKWPLFAPLFPSKPWVETLIVHDMNVSRRPLAHMNPLATDDIANMENAFRKWAKQLKAVEGQIP